VVEGYTVSSSEWAEAQLHYRILSLLLQPPIPPNYRVFHILSHTAAHNLHSILLVAAADDDIAFLLFSLGVPMGLGHLLEGKASIDDRPQLYSA
jgi:hypothetical protein